MPDQKPPPGTTAPAGAGSQGPAPEQQRSPAQQVEAASAAPGEQRSVSVPRTRAAESGHPDAHKALADLQTARLNLRTAREGNPTEEKAAAEAERRALDQLRDLGYEE